MEFETVRRIPMRNLSLEICGQVDDVDGTKRAFLGTFESKKSERSVQGLGRSRQLTKYHTRYIAFPR